MGTHIVKTTLDIADALLTEAKRAAKRRGIPLRRLIEEALRRVLQETPRKPFKLKDRSIDGGWLRPEFRDLPWSEIRAIANDRRGDEG